MMPPMSRAPVYLDCHATTPTDPRVLEAMLPYFAEKFGNAASRQHAFGREAEEAVERARAQVAALVGASPREISFTSGGTESNNLALKGVAARHAGGHIITSATEHPSVLDPLRRLEIQGFDVTRLPVDWFGRVSADQVAEAITERTVLVSLMAANNEVGTLHPIADIARVCRERGVLFHTDAVQAAGKIPLDVGELGVGLLSLTAHKMYGPKGVGALYVRRGVRLAPILDGGGHERGLRSGTLPVPLIVGFGAASEICAQEMTEEAERLTRLRERLRQTIIESLPDTTLNGHPTERLPGNLNLAFPFIDGNALMVAMKSVAVSSGSACTSANPEPSHVLKALGLPEELVRGSIRFGLGRFSTEEEVDYAAGEVIRAAKQLREMSPLAELAGVRPGGRT